MYCTVVFSAYITRHSAFSSHVSLTSRHHHHHRSHTHTAQHCCDAVLCVLFLVHAARKHVHQYAGNGQSLRREWHADRRTGRTIYCERFVPVAGRNRYRAQSLIVHARLCLCTQFGPRYDWSPFDQSLLLGAYFWGYAITSIPTGILCEKYGGKDVVTYIFGLCVLFTALMPVLAQFPVWLMCVMRFLIGFVSVGFFFSSYFFSNVIIHFPSCIFHRAAFIRHCTNSCRNGHRRTRRANSRRPSSAAPSAR